MSSRKRKAKGPRPKSAPPTLDETLEHNAPHDVEIQSFEGVQDAPTGENPIDASELPTVEMPAIAAALGVDLEMTVDLRGPLEMDAPLRDDSEEAEETAELEAADVGEAAEEPAEEKSAEPDAAEDEGADSITTSATDRERANLKGLVEALVFATDKPIKVGELARLTDAAPKLIRALLLELGEDYKPRGIQLSEVAGGYLFRTNVRYGSFVRELTQQKPVRLSRAQLEALAILAYRQPITRPEIDEIRGVDSGPVLKMLLERELVRILGKRDEVGRPLIYGTTPEFLEFFGLKSLKDLPNLREFTELTDESHAIAEKELGESWRGPEGEGEAAEDAGESTPAERGDVEVTDESEAAPAEPAEEEEEEEARDEVDDAERDAEEERIALDSVVEHVSAEEAEGETETETETADDDDGDSEEPAAEEPVEEPATDDEPQTDP